MIARTKLLSATLVTKPAFRSFKATALFSCLAAAAGLGLAAVSAPANEIEGPFVGNVTADSAVIWWRCATPVSGEVAVGGRKLRDDQPPFEERISGLEAGKSYGYYVQFDNGERRPREGVYTFHTAPAKGSEDTFSFAVMCDSRGTKPSEPVNVRVLQALLEDARSKSARFVCFPGDMILGYCGDEDEYRRQLRLWKSAVSDVLHEMPIYVTMGNHDVLTHRDRDKFGSYDIDGVLKGGKLVASEDVLSEEFVNPTDGPASPEKPQAPAYGETCYSFDYGDAHFVVLNTNYWMATRSFPHEPGDPCRLYERGYPEGLIMDRQMAWVSDDLRRARSAGARHIFVFAHEPAFPVGAHADDAMYYEGDATLSLKRAVRARRHTFWKMLSDNGVLVAFFGDEHNYSRSLIGPAGDAIYDPPVWHIITGGAGAPPSDLLRRDLPWSDSIRRFENLRHYCLVTVRGRQASLEVYALPADFEAKGAPQLDLIDRVADLTIRN
jgi:hypothetical protein